MNVDKSTDEGWLVSLIEEATDVENEEVDDTTLRNIKSVCKRGDEYVTTAWSVVFRKLKENDSRVRLREFETIGRER